MQKNSRKKLVAKRSRFALRHNVERIEQLERELEAVRQDLRAVVVACQLVLGTLVDRHA